MINCLKDSIHVLMSVLLCTNGDDAHQEVVDHVDSNSTEENGDVVDAKEDESLSGEDTLTLKSSLRKEVDSNSSEADSKRNKKKVHWVDLMGIKELAEIRVFELSEEDYMDSNRGRTCECVIL
ncbi:unnamed protein product [Cochlearia groenlandica]